MPGNLWKFLYKERIRSALHLWSEKLVKMCYDAEDLNFRYKKISVTNRETKESKGNIAKDLFSKSLKGNQ